VFAGTRHWPAAPAVAWSLLWPGGAAAADGAFTLDWPLAAVGGVVVALAAAVPVLLRMRRQVADLARRGEQATAAAQQCASLLDAAPDGYLFWPVGEAALSDGDGGNGGHCSTGLSESLGLPPTGGWEQFRDRLVPRARNDLAAALTALRDHGRPFDLPVEVAESGRSLQLLGRRAAADGHGAADIVWVHDVTAAVQALAEARAAAERAEAERESFEMLLNSLPLPVWRRRADLGLDWCNAAYGRIVGRDPEAAAASGRELGAGVIDREGRGLGERALKTRVAQSESHPVVVDGARRLFDFNESPLWTADGGMNGLCGYAQDVTALEEVQQELARHIASHAEVLEQLASGIAIFGSDMRLKFFNQSYVRLWGLDAGWLHGEPTIGEVLEALRERRRLPEHADFQAFKQERLRLFTSLMEPMEELVYRPDDTTIRMVVTPHPFGGLVFIFEDVTDRLALERSRLWDLIPEDIADGPHISDLLEKTKRAFPPRDEWPVLKQRIIARITEPEPRTGRLERMDGMVLNYACVPLPDGACLLSYVDITDSTRVERALRERNEALETADRLKTEFIANVSYELRTPLNAIIGFTEILDKNYFGTLNQRQGEYTQGVLEASHRLLALINDILDLASIEAGYLRLELAPVDLHGMLDGVIGLTRQRAHDVGLGLRLECPADLGSFVGDERRLKQALFNLVSNAIKFTGPGGEVVMSGRRERTDAGEGVVLEVADTGIGIREADQQRVFEKFLRVNPAARESGPGLGLSLVKSLVELHGGRVQVVSDRGSGTRVLCHLPVRTAAEAEPGAQPPMRSSEAAGG
jgi:signal transduction histidine kinase